MCNLYSITTNQEAIIRLFRKVNPELTPDRSASMPRPSHSKQPRRSGQRAPPYSEDCIGLDCRKIGIGVR
jgi:hypothetical protein